MKKLIASFALAVSLLLVNAFAGIMPAAHAQTRDTSGVWIQVAARPSLLEAEEEARNFAARLPDVAGFALGGGWYGIVIGPYARDDAEQVLQVYRREGQIPRDSFITFSSNLRTRFYPVGNAAITQPEPAPEVVTEAPATPAGIATGTPTITSALPDETPAEARRSEQALTREDKKLLQVALQAAGFYTSAIDGAFGRGTRRSMSDWQRARGFTDTGVLTTAQRQQLLDEYNAPLISTGMALFEDTRAGISLQLPLKAVTFSRYEPPFAHFDTNSDVANNIPGARVLLISQPGDRRTLYGLYDIMQTLEIVPLEGPRARKGDSFTLEGTNSEITSYTEAQLIDGQIKGFTLVWPTGDEARRARVLATMKASFTRTSGVLDPATGIDTAQIVDLVSGLDVRKPLRSGSGFFVTGDGVAATSAALVAGCGRVTLDRDTSATVSHVDSASGLALLTPNKPLAPQAQAELAQSSPFLNSAVAVSGFSYGGVLGAPSLTWGSLSDLKGLKGEAELARLDLTALEGDAGGPLMDKSGRVLGLLLPVATNQTTLPEGVRFALKADAIQAVLEQAGLTAAGTSSQGSDALPIAQLQRRASAMTTLVSCWE